MSNSNIAAKNQQVLMGAGEFFVKPYEGGGIKLKEICVDDNYAGETQGGAEFNYSMTPYVIEDDNGKLRKRFMTKAEAYLKTGLLTVDVKALGNLMSVGVLKAAEEGSGDVLELTGGNAAFKQFVVVYRYPKDKEKGLYIYIGMVATNTAPLTLAFAKDKETVVELQFDADTNGVNDVLVTFHEDQEEQA